MWEIVQEAWGVISSDYLEGLTEWSPMAVIAAMSCSFCISPIRNNFMGVFMENENFQVIPVMENLD